MPVTPSTVDFLFACAVLDGPIPPHDWKRNRYRTHGDEPVVGTHAAPSLVCPHCGVDNENLCPSLVTREWDDVSRVSAGKRYQFPIVTLE